MIPIPMYNKFGHSVIMVGLRDGRIGTVEISLKGCCRFTLRYFEHFQNSLNFFFFHINIREHIMIGWKLKRVWHPRCLVGIMGRGDGGGSRCRCGAHGKIAGHKMCCVRAHISFAGEKCNSLMCGTGVPGTRDVGQVAARRTAVMLFGMSGGAHRRPHRRACSPGGEGGGTRTGRERRARTHAHFLRVSSDPSRSPYFP